MNKKSIIGWAIIFFINGAFSAHRINQQTPAGAGHIRESYVHTLNSLPVEGQSSWDALPFTLEDVENAVYPWKFDWREQGGVTAIDYQPDYGCGGCWVYAATAVFESLIKIRTGVEVDLSEEHVSSCLRNGDHTGIAWQAFNQMQEKGVTTEEFVPCNLSLPAACQYPNNADYYFLNDSWIVGMWDTPLDQRIKIMKYVIHTYGPVASGFVVYQDWGNYRSGVYTWDGQSPMAGHHSIEIVGWVDDPAIANGGYWIVKNDFGPQWGEDGFFNIGYGECEIDMAFMFAHYDPYTVEPVFAVKVGTRYAWAEDQILLNISARVPEGKTVRYRADNVPQGGVYNETTGRFTWAPTAAQTGIFEITFSAYYEDHITSQTGTFVIQHM